MFRPRTLLRWVVVTLVLAFGLSGVQAVTLDVNAFDRGHYRHLGDHVTTNTNYGVGNTSSGSYYHNWFIFDLSALLSPIREAQLRLENPEDWGGDAAADGYLSGDPTETYALFDVTSDLSDLVNGTGGIATFQDLGTGTSYGSVVVSPADNGAFVAVDLNSAGLAAVNAALGGHLAIGGALTSLDGDDSTQEIMFAYSNWGTLAGHSYLRLTPIPEPGTALLLLAGTLAAALHRRRTRPTESTQ